jgi:hypothetical protein
MTNFTKVEVSHHEPDDVRLALEASLELLEACEVPDDLRTVAFSAVFASFTAKTVTLVPLASPSLAGLNLGGGIH